MMTITIISMNIQLVVDTYVPFHTLFAEPNEQIACFWPEQRTVSMV